jgi:hypothetical protein
MIISQINKILQNTAQLCLKTVLKLPFKNDKFILHKF